MNADLSRLQELAEVVDWLAGLLAAPLPAAAVEAYRDDAGDRLFDAIAEELACTTAIAHMRDALRARDSPDAAALDLSVAYTRLFEGVSGAATVPLCESAYTSADGRPYGPASADMDALLRRFGVGVAPSCVEPPDHVSLELALLAARLREGDAEGAARLLGRLCRWLPELTRRCRASDPRGFYGAVAALLQTLLSMQDCEGGDPSFVRVQQD